MSSEDSNSFELLEKVNPIDWINIPDPLRNGLFCLKDCIFKLKDLISLTNSSILSNSEVVNKKFEVNDETSNFLKTMIETTDHNARAKITEVSENLSTDLIIFKKNLAQDLDFKQKSTDKKLSIVEESMFTTKKIVQCLMTPNEVEEKITKAVKEAKISVKNEINDYIITPEIRQINVRIGFIGESLDKGHAALEDSIEKFKLSVRKNEEIVEERLKNIENAINGINEQRNKDMKSYEGFFKGIKSEIAGVDKEINKKVGLLGLNLEKIQKIVQEQDKKFVGFKANMEKIEKIEKELSDFKVNQEEQFKVLEEKSTKKKKKSKKAKKSPSKLKSEDYSDSIVDTESKFEVSKSPQVPELLLPPQEPQNLKSLNGDLTLPINQVTQNPPMAVTVPPQTLSTSRHSSKSSIPTPVHSSSSPTKKKQVFCKSPDMKPFDTNSTHLSQAAAIIQPIDLQSIDEKIAKLFSDQAANFRKSLNEKQIELNSGLQDIREKLSWFPMTINEVKGKNLNEARIFTIEARLRMEENSRVEQFNQIVSLINQIKAEISVSTPVSNLPYLHQGRLSVRHDRKHSAEGFTDYIKIIPESEGKINPFVPKALKTVNKYSKLN